MKTCKALINFFFIASLSAQMDISFMRFYMDESSFLSDVRLLSTQRFNNPHIQVFYNSKKEVVLKEWINAQGELIKRELFDYSNGKPIRRYYLNSSSRPDSVKYFGEDEPWSKEFRKVTDPRKKDYFSNQESVFILNEQDQFDRIRFNTVQGFPYGEISFFYNHLGLLVGELWKVLPEKITVRKYAYSTDMLTGRKEIREYNHQAEQVSRVVLSQPPAESLYKTKPPRSGNKLDEISILLEDIRSKDLKIPFDVFIPKTDHDLMVLTNGDSILVENLELGQQQVKFSVANEDGQLTMPIIRIKTIISKYGEPIFP